MEWEMKEWHTRFFQENQNRTCPYGRPKIKWEDNIFRDFKKIDYEGNQMAFTQDRVTWRAHVLAAMNFGGFLMSVSELISYGYGLLRDGWRDDPITLPKKGWGVVDENGNETTAQKDDSSSISVLKILSISLVGICQTSPPYVKIL